MRRSVVRAEATADQLLRTATPREVAHYQRRVDRDNDVVLGLRREPPQ
jgi:hypothetical protein